MSNPGSDHGERAATSAGMNPKAEGTERLVTSIAGVANALRKRLGVLRMAIEFCADTGSLSDDQTELLLGAREDCGRLDVMVAELLDLADIHAGRLKLYKTAVSASSLLEQAVEAHRSAAADSQVALRLRESDVGAVLADPARAKDVLAHLLSNALRYTPPGGVVELRAIAAEDHIRFEVHDTGTGIAGNRLSGLFDLSFSRSESASYGAGVGLYTSRSMTEAHGGKMGVISELDRGSLFWFTLPCAPSGD